MDTDPNINSSWYLGLASFAGALVSLAHLQKLTIYEKVVSVFSGTLLAFFCGPAVAEYLHTTARQGAALHFFMGLGGLTLTGAAIAIFRAIQANPAAVLTALAQLKKGGGTS